MSKCFDYWCSTCLFSNVEIYDWNRCDICQKYTTNNTVSSAMDRPCFYEYGKAVLVKEKTNES